KTWSTLLSASKTAKPATPGTKAKPGAGTYVLKFTKNHRYPTYSTLSLLRDGNVLKTYRAGSGEDGVTDECASGKGWLPNGTYKIKGHETNRNDGWFKTGIKGNAIQLEDKYCKPKPGRTPVKRTALYIHSEMLSDGTQNPVYLPGVDNYYRWDGDFDYESWGCIKLAPKDIKDLFKRLNQAYWPKNLTLQVR
ncbi:L,D-transpeptidase, partial [Streptomyces sp. NPDC001698]|uniref:L,D-transpeptidase n=1 Tax=Streptomyces sp. NPDC001698 TaxID=3364601 RepID=UPI00369C7414